MHAKVYKALSWVSQHEIIGSACFESIYLERVYATKSVSQYLPN